MVELPEVHNLTTSPTKFLDTTKQLKNINAPFDSCGQAQTYVADYLFTYV